MLSQGSWFHSMNVTVSALESYQSDTLSSLFSIHPVGGLSGGWGLEQYQTPGRFTPSLHLLFILSTWPPARKHCAIGLHSRHSQSLFFYFHSSLAVCASVSLFPLLLLSRRSIFFSLSVLLLSFHPALTYERLLKIETAEKLEVKDPPLKAQLR